MLSYYKVVEYALSYKFKGWFYLRCCTNVTMKGDTCLGSLVIDVVN